MVLRKKSRKAMETINNAVCLLLDQAKNDRKASRSEKIADPNSTRFTMSKPFISPNAKFRKNDKVKY
jgi:hypothetical protein